MQPQDTKIVVNRQTFRRCDRFRRRSEYLHVQQHGQRVHTAYFVILVLAGETGVRLGITVTKKVANAVGRNRIKRLVREVYRRNRQLFPQNSQIVMIARSGAEKLNYMLVKQDVERARAALMRAFQLSSAHLNTYQ